VEEKTMFPIIKNHLESLGFDVKAEVDDVDIMAQKDNKTLLVEMKQHLNLSLIYQGIERQKLTDYVYLAIPEPTGRVLSSKTFKEKKAIAKRLGLGLILVDLKLSKPTFLIDPHTPVLHKDHKKRKKMHKEFLLRQTALNHGGVTRTKIITAYRELALRIVDILSEGERPVKDIVNQTGQLKATRVLIDNHYGWFHRVKRGVYTLSDDGEEAKKAYADVIKTLRTLNE